jgi:nucleoside-diphosphate-sugar epimerase
MTLQPVLVTGAGGFIGRALVGRLRAAGAEVVRVRDLARDPVWDGAARRCGGMVHLANIAHARVDRAELERVNVEGTRRLAEQALAAGVRRFVYVSSIKVHGNESPAGGFSAASAIDPADAYGETKARAERALRELEAQGLQLTILRPPLVYGASVRANFLALARAVDRRLPLPLASVRNRRSLVYVGNLADAIVRCLETPASVGRAYPLSDEGAAPSTPELCVALGIALGRPARLVRCPPSLLEIAAALVGRRAAALSLTRNLEVDGSDFRRLGWRAPYTLADGLRATAEWFRGGKAPG